VSAVQFCDPVEQLFGLSGSEADTFDVLDARPVLVGVILAELRDAGVRPEQRQSHERTRKSTPTTQTVLCLGDAADKASNFRPNGHGFDSRSEHNQGT